MTSHGLASQWRREARRPLECQGARAHPLGCLARPETAQGGLATRVRGMQMSSSGDGRETAVSGHNKECERCGVTRERRCIYWLGEGKLDEAGAAVVASLASDHSRRGASKSMRQWQWGMEPCMAAMHGARATVLSISPSA